MAASFAGATAGLPGLRRVRAALALGAALVLTACSGIETIPDDTAQFANTGYTRYAWRSEPLSGSSHAASRMYQADPIIRGAVDQRMAELGYRRVAKDEAEFLVDYLAAAGLNEGQLARNASNIDPVPTGRINRQINQAEVDNAYALSGVREMGNVALVFLEREGQATLWKVLISTVIDNVNTVDEDGLRRAMRQGMQTLPKAER